MKEKARSRQHRIETMTDADYADYLLLLANTSAQAKSLPHSLEQAGLYMNTSKTVFMCFKPKEAISIFSGKLLKLFDQFTYLCHNISSTENAVNIHLAKVWHVIDRLLTWKSDL